MLVSQSGLDRLLLLLVEEGKSLVFGYDCDKTHFILAFIKLHGAFCGEKKRDFNSIRRFCFLGTSNIYFS